MSSGGEVCLLMKSVPGAADRTDQLWPLNPPDPTNPSRLTGSRVGGAPGVAGCGEYGMQCVVPHTTEPEINLSLLTHTQYPSLHTSCRAHTLPVLSHTVHAPQPLPYPQPLPARPISALSHTPE